MKRGGERKVMSGLLLKLWPCLPYQEILLRLNDDREFPLIDFKHAGKSSPEGSNYIKKKNINKNDKTCILL